MMNLTRHQFETNPWFIVSTADTPAAALKAANDLRVSSGRNTAILPPLQWQAAQVWSVCVHGADLKYQPVSFVNGLPPIPDPGRTIEKVPEGPHPSHR